MKPNGSVYVLAWLFACSNGLAWLIFHFQVKEVCLGKQFFLKRQAGI